MDAKASCVFICTAEEFNEMSVQLKHKIFKHRHILVLDTHNSHAWNFDEKSLARMGSLDMNRQLQCKSVLYLIRFFATDCYP